VKKNFVCVDAGLAHLVHIKLDMVILGCIFDIGNFETTNRNFENYVLITIKAYIYYLYYYLLSNFQT